MPEPFSTIIPIPPFTVAPDELIMLAEQGSLEQLRGYCELIKDRGGTLDLDGCGQRSYPALVACLQDTVSGQIPAKMDFLLGLGCQPDALGLNGNPAIHFAAQEEYDAAFRRLLGVGAKWDTADSRGRTALHFATQHGRAWAAVALIDLGETLERRDSRERTPLFHACENDWPEGITLLLASGADETVRDIEGRSCWNITNDAGRAALDAGLLQRATHSKPAGPKPRL